MPLDELDTPVLLALLRFVPAESRHALADCSPPLGAAAQPLLLEPSPSERLPGRPPPAPQEAAGPQAGCYRLRFFNFNTAKSAEMRCAKDIAGPGGGGLLHEVLEEPFAGGAPVDAAFVTFTETRVSLRREVEECQARWRQAPPASGLDKVSLRNGVRSRIRHGLSLPAWMSGISSLVTPLVGNVKTMLALRGSCFEEEDREDLLGTLAVNPEKSFVGMSIVAREQGLRLCFIGAHFPMRQLTKVLVDPEVHHRLEAAKRLFAGFLRNVLEEVSRWQLADAETAVFVQGDLNSRTLIEGVESRDILLEVLHDDELQEAIGRDLEMPAGRWHEIVPHRSIEELPVTYKFSRQAGSAQTLSLTMGDLVGGAKSLAAPANGSSRYKQMLENLGGDWRGQCGFKKDLSAFQDRHFPACTDRILYWAPDTLASRMSWTFPRNGYQALQCQGGSDHRPVAMEAILQVEPRNSLAADGGLDSFLQGV